MLVDMELEFNSYVPGFQHIFLNNGTIASTA